MAKLSDLTRAVAAVSSRSETTIAVTARSLREAGLIPTGGRGVNAPQMTSRDAATLLIGLACPGDHTKVGQYVPQAGSLKLEARASGRGNDFAATNKLTKSFGVFWGQSFLDALTSLIHHYRLEPAPAETAQAPKLFGYTPVPTDVPPQTVEICVTTDGIDWNAEVLVGRARGGSLSLCFSRYGDLAIPIGPACNKPGHLEIFATTLKPHTFHAAVNCIRNDDMPLWTSAG